MKNLRLFCLIGGALLGGFILFSVGQHALTWLYTSLRLDSPEDSAKNPITFGALVLFGASAGAAFIGNTSYRLLGRTIENWDRLDNGAKITIFVGLTLGVVLTVPFITLFLSQPAMTSVPLSLGVLLLVTAVTISALRSVDEALPWSKNRGRGRRSNIKILDTNVIIDGRIYDIVRTGFLDGQLYVPKFVLKELQFIADEQDALRRARGKRGLEVLHQLQAVSAHLEVGIHDRLAPDQHDGVDARLVRLARALGADLVTNDHNLNRVAALQEIKVVNVNELALALRPTVLPGEAMEIFVAKEGSQFGQGVGYLDDGTMVVIEHGKSHLNETVSVVVTQVHQTERGKMIFADVRTGESPELEGSQRRKYRR